MLFCFFLHVLSWFSVYVVSTSASDGLERHVSEVTYNVLMGTLNLLTHSLEQGEVEWECLQRNGHHNVRLSLWISVISLSHELGNNHVPLHTLKNPSMGFAV